MKLDTKQKVLIAIYTEYQRDIPNIKEEVTYQKLGIGAEEFKIAVIKLENELLITGTNMPSSKAHTWGVFCVMLDKTRMTPYGIEYVENKLGIDKTLSGIDKVKKVGEKCATWGWNESKDIIVKVLSEMGKHGIDKAFGG
ncbi:MAG: hypothetical protein KZY55_15640 [Paeniclostridium sp.]|nr:YjcQ family protein [Paeniclostridium sp.]MBW4861757.1 hypothetical protein [Paeniclostridium sp.]MBW4875489.1 hypothetical protein [Paeniclostridium sp.]